MSRCVPLPIEFAEPSVACSRRGRKVYVVGTDVTMEVVDWQPMERGRGVCVEESGLGDESPTAVLCSIAEDVHGARRGAGGGLGHAPMRV